MRSKVDSISLSRNCILQVPQVPKALKTIKEQSAEFVEIARLGRVTTIGRSKVNSIPQPQNCAIEVA